MSPICEQLTTSVGALFTCSPLNGYIRIRTPFLYPDGDVIDLYYEEKQGIATITDLGETLRWLRMQTMSEHKSVKQRQLINDICLNHGVEFYRGTLTVRLKPGDDFAQAVTRLAQAALRVSDLSFTFRSRSTESFADEVEDLLRSRQVQFERKPPIPGRSGTIWRPDFHARLPNQSAFVSVLSTGNRATAKEIVAYATAEWFDLSNWAVGPEAVKFISLFDDTTDVWTEEDYRLVKEISDIAYWSRRDEFLEKLAA
jgi:hypothetical protein